MYGGSRILLKENLWYETPLHAACTSGYSIDLVNYLAEQEGIFINHQVFIRINNSILFETLVSIS